MSNDKSQTQSTAEPYRPSCGSEGHDFMDRFCDRCLRDDAFRRGAGDSCPIAAATMAFGITEPEYPVEWIYGPNGPTCTAFEPMDDVIRDARQIGLAL